jgi:hypothetical protein
MRKTKKGRSDSRKEAPDSDKGGSIELPHQLSTLPAQEIKAFVHTTPIDRSACGQSAYVSASALCFVCLQRLESKLKHSASPVLWYLLRPRDCFEPGYLDGFTNWPLKDFVIAVADCNVARPAAACNKKTNLNITLYLLEPRLSGILRYHGLQRVPLGFGTRFGVVNSIDGCDLALCKHTTANQEQQDR